MLRPSVADGSRERRTRITVAGLAAIGGLSVVVLAGAAMAMMMLRGRTPSLASGPAADAARATSNPATKPAGSAPATPASRRSLSDWQASDRTTAPPPSGPDVPLYSERWIDDGGALFGSMFTEQIADTTSLEQTYAVAAARARRGITILEGELAALDSTRQRDRPDIVAVNLVLGTLHLSLGEFDQAIDRFDIAQRAQLANPNGKELVAVNIEALKGVAEMRRGETENCVACCNEASCIFPLEPAAFHQQTRGSRAAIGHFMTYLERRPNDLGVQWLLNVAHMTLGEYPDKVPKQYLIPLAPFQSKIDIGRFPNVATRVGLGVRGENMSGGMIVDDFNNDGWLDVVTSTRDPGQGGTLFLNKGDGTFEDHSESSGLAAQRLSLMCTQVDYDNDGWLDVFFARGAWDIPMRPSLMRNKGDGTFEDVTIEAGLVDAIASQAIGWADFDNDGLLDLYMGGEYDVNRPDPRNRGKLYHNLGGGKFIDVADTAGVQNRRYAKGAAWGDYDNDGLPDLYVANKGEANRLYHNNGDGTFTDLAPKLGVTEPLGSFPCWIWDYDNDGWLDIFVASSSAYLGDIVKSHLGQPAEGEKMRLFRNMGPEGFKNVTDEVGLDRLTLVMGSNFGDLDNDGWLDMYLGTGSPNLSHIIPNLMFKNVGGKRFEDITTSTGTGHLQKGHGVSFADWDRDGDVDVFVEAGGPTKGDLAHNLLFENPGQGNHWLVVKLVGTKTNRCAIGARLRVDVPGPDGKPSPRHRLISSGSSFGANPLMTMVGLGKAEKVLAVEVWWPTSGQRQVLHDLPIDSAIEITEGKDGFRRLEWTPAGKTRAAKPVAANASPAAPGD